VVFANYTDLTMSLMAFILPVIIAIAVHERVPSDQGSTIVLGSFGVMTVLSVVTGIQYNWRSGRGFLGCVMGPVTKVLITWSFVLMVFRIFGMFNEAKNKKTASARYGATILAIFWAVLIAKFMMWLTRITVVRPEWGSLGEWLTGRMAVNGRMAVAGAVSAPPSARPDSGLMARNPGLARAIEQADMAAASAALHGAERGDAGSQFNLGNKYLNGQGVPQDYAKAAEWFKKAAEQGNAEAQYLLGCMYNKGHGVPQNEAEAVQWVKKAAAQGHPKARETLRELEQKKNQPPAESSQPPVHNASQMADEIAKLHELKDKGILSEEEFQEAKKKVLAS
jgi:hypothetical protein